MQLPEGFHRIESDSPFIDLNGPFYYKEDGAVLRVGLQIELKHSNSAGNVHGGLIATLADLALGSSIGHSSLTPDERAEWRRTGTIPRGPVPRATVSLNLDFVGPAVVGDWLEVRVTVRRLGKTLSFANATLEVDGQSVASSAGVYRSFGG